MKKVTIICFLIALAVGFNFMNSAMSNAKSHKFHTPEELAQFKGTAKRAPLAPGEFFLPSTNCRGCHGFDSAYTANINENGDDINLVDRWESSMMAMAAKDPLWRAKVSQEILVNPGHALELQDKCTSCHAPLGRYTSLYHGNPHFTMADLATDTLGLDGVSCGACHAISPTVGFSYSGLIPFDTTDHVEYGPFTSPYVGPMQLYEGFTPTYSDHMDQARVCSSCHTLVTETVDLSGNPTGGHFVEQATYHEYLNSDFPANNITCQTCHMPKLTDPIIIANGTSGLTPRFPFNQHKFAGANYFMLNLIKNNRDSLGVTVPAISFDSSIVATADQLRLNSINFDLQNDSITPDTAYFSVKLENKAGHKFPSGYPARRAVVQFVVTDASGDTLFSSGLFDDEFRVIGENPSFEPHHNVINQTNKPQIYEMAMGDVTSSFTSVLERAAVVLKDNRLPPVGFTSSHPTYDSMIVSADADGDPDFNKISSIQGSGIDYVHFHVPVTGTSGNLKILSKVYYQSVPPKWLDEMFAMSSPEINKFKAMFNAADQNPFLVASDSIVNLLVPMGINTLKAAGLNVWPTISMDGKVYVSAEFGQMIRSVDVIGSDGKLYGRFASNGFEPEIVVSLPQVPGVYYLRILTGNKIYYKKVVKS
jgi:hypothetical protein